MSATNRGADRVEDDFYVTPHWATRRILDAIPALPGGHWLEPCAGDGAIVKVVQAVRAPDSFTLVELGDRITGLQEAAPRARIYAPRDYLHPSPTPYPHGVTRFDVAITNPPFSIAERVIKRALYEADWVVMLVRQGFLGSARSSWLRHEMPDVYNLPERPSFIASYKCKGRDKSDNPDGCGWTTKTPVDAPRFKTCPRCGRDLQRSSSDSAEYCWLVWSPERGRNVGKVAMLESTPDAERGVKSRRRTAA